MAKARSTKASRRRSHSHRRRPNSAPSAPPRRRSRPRARKRSRGGNRPNPGFGRVSGLLGTGISVVGGLVGTSLVTQAALGPKNSGPLGYLANVAVAVGLSYFAGKAFKSPHARNMVLAGGIGWVVIRMIRDYTPLGKFVDQNLAGMGIRGDTGMGLLLTQSYADPAIYDDSGAKMPAGWRAASVAAARAAVSAAVPAAVAGRGMGASTYRMSTYR